MSVEVREREIGWLGGEDARQERVLKRLNLPDDPRPHLVDATMLYAPRSGGVKRYLTAKRAWLAHGHR